MCNKCSTSDKSEHSQAESQGSKPDLIAIEHEMLKLWEKQDSFKRLNELRKDAPRFRFIDGPITANNPMGVHHAWGRTLKDIFLRYKALSGHQCHYQNGFDCQGLWVEVEVEKELGFNGKPDIEAYGLDKFSRACRARVEKYSALQTEQSKRLGQWMDWDNSYYTYTDLNIESIWHFLKKCDEKGWLYESTLSMPWCSRCGTSLSEHEMAGSYKDLSHLAVYIKVPVPELDAKILVWTTTPWTLSANVALAVNPTLEYSEITLEGSKEKLIISSTVLSRWTKPYSVLKTYKGSELVGKRYEAIIANLPAQQNFEHKIVPWDEVDPSEGTGTVHIAPGCGREDFKLGKELELPQLCPVDEKGLYTEQYGWLSGRNAQDVAQDVADYLEKENKLFKSYMHDHSYPVCWRCKSELIFRVAGEWYISSEEIRPDIIKAAEEVHWQPPYLKKRMIDWLSNMSDWCISRKRFWGLPLPFYPCESCGEVTVIGSKEELSRLSGDDLNELPELHRPWIDDIEINCPKCSAKVKRVIEVGDCWLDAGIVPYSTRGYLNDRSEWENWYPAEWICEMSEQVRLWFYSMLFMSTTISGRAPYERVLTYERVRAEDGTKFSKTGFMIEFHEAAEKMGVDTMRYYFAKESPTNDIRFGYGIGDETRRQLLSFWNIYSFFMTYAEIDKPELRDDILKEVDKLPETDRWLLARTEAFLATCRSSYEQYNSPAVIREFESYIEELSNWYIRANRRRFWKSEMSHDKLSGYAVLFKALRSLCLVMGPITPFITEKIWQACIRRFDLQADESVHHGLFPRQKEAFSDEKLLKQTSSVRDIINHAHRLRTEAQMKIRQPLKALYVAADKEVKEALIRFESLLVNEINVKELHLLDSRSELLSEYLELNLAKAGPVLKGAIKAATEAINALSEEQANELVPQVKEGQAIKLEGVEAELPAEILVVKSKARSDLVLHEEDELCLALTLTITPELEREGWVRDILRQCQVLRRDSGLEVEDRIALSLETTDPALLEALREHQALIESETLSSLSLEPIKDALGEKVIKLPKAEVAARLKKA